MSVLIHLVVHLLFEELTPQFLNLEISPSSDLTLISVLISSCFSNLLLLLDAINSLLQCLFLVLDAVLQSDDPLIPLLLLVLNVLHEIIEPIARLQLLLLSNPLLFKLLFVDLVLAPERLLQLVGANLQSNEVLLHPGKHVNELLLMQLFEVVPLIDHFNALLGVVGLEVSAMSLLLDQPLLLSDLLYPFLQIKQSQKQ